MTAKPTLADLRTPFPPEQVGRLPKGGVMLDYVGHAAITDRLLTVDPEWSWAPLALDPRGLPCFDEYGGLWIRLTVLGVTRLGYGDAAGKKGPNAVKEAIGDALRNAGMRFGLALDLWHKGDLHVEPPLPPDPLAQIKREVWVAFTGLYPDTPTREALAADYADVTGGQLLSDADADDLRRYLDHLGERAA